MNSLSDFSPACECRFPCFDVASGVLMQRNGLTADEARGTMWRFAELQDITMHALSEAVVASTAHARPLNIW
jgi:ANTAR domain